MIWFMRWNLKPWWLNIKMWTWPRDYKEKETYNDAQPSTSHKPATLYGEGQFSIHFFLNLQMNPVFQILMLSVHIVQMWPCSTSGNTLIGCICHGLLSRSWPVTVVMQLHSPFQEPKSTTTTYVFYSRILLW